MKLALVSLALLGALVGCGPDYDRTEISTSVRVLGNDVDQTSVKVVQGTVVVAHIASFDTNGKRMSVRVRSNDERLLDVNPSLCAILGHERERLVGMTVPQTLKSWTAMKVVSSIVGISIVMAGHALVR